MITSLQHKVPSLKSLAATILLLAFSLPAGRQGFQLSAGFTGGKA